MTTKVRPTTPTATVHSLSNLVPVEVEERDDAGHAWVKLSGRWTRVQSMENLWVLDGEWQGRRPVIRFHFNAALEGRRRIALVQDLVEGAWYRKVALGD